MASESQLPSLIPKTKCWFDFHLLLGLGNREKLQEENGAEKLVWYKLVFSLFFFSWNWVPCKHFSFAKPLRKWFGFQMRVCWLFRQVPTCGCQLVTDGDGKCCKGGSFRGGSQAQGKGEAAKCQPGCLSLGPRFGDTSELAGAMVPVAGWSSARLRNAAVRFQRARGHVYHLSLVCREV